MNFNLKKENETNIYESPDGGKTVYVRKSNQDPKFRSRVIINHDDPFIDELLEKGYTFDIGNSWYRRRWSTNNGAPRSDRTSIDRTQNTLGSGNLSSN